MPCRVYVGDGADPYDYTFVAREILWEWGGTASLGCLGGQRALV